MFLNSPGNGLFFLVKIKRETIAEIAQAILPGYTAYLVDVQVRGERGETLLQVLVDTDSGISIEHCAKISREIAGRIEELDLIQTRFRLEVSSPGLDRPLKVLQQYGTHTGRTVTVTWKEGEQERSEHGTLRGVDGTSVLVELPDGSIHTIAFDHIRECRHRLPW